MNSSREEYNILRDADTRLLTDVWRAARFFYLTRLGFGGKGSTYGISCDGRFHFNKETIQEKFKATSERLERVYVENQPYEKMFRFDKPGTFFYIDPPYWDCESDYGKGIFGKNDFVRLSQIMRTLQGKAMMSINNTVDIRHIFRNFNIQEVQTTYSIRAGKGSTKKVTELIITNY